MTILEAVADGRPGGGTTLVLGLCLRLVESGHTVHLATDSGSYAAREASGFGATVHELPFFEARTIGRLRSAFLNAADSSQPEVVHLHGIRAGFLLGKLCAGRGEAWVYTVHGYHFERKRAAKRTLGRLLQRWGVRRLRRFVFVSEHERAMGVRLGLVPREARTSVIPNAVDLADLPSRTPHEGFEAAYLGRLTPDKDPILMAEIAAKLSGHGIRTTLIGGGALEGKVRRRIADLGSEGSVEITGSLSHREALERPSRADVLVMPSRWEAFGIALIEAMGMGIPVVAAAVGGVPEVVRNGETGILVRSRDPAEFADAVLRIRDSEQTREAMASLGPTWVRERFTWDRCLAAHLELYETAASSRQAVGP